MIEWTPVHQQNERKKNRDFFLERRRTKMKQIITIYLENQRKIVRLYMSFNIVQSERKKTTVKLF